MWVTKHTFTDAQVKLHTNAIEMISSVQGIGKHELPHEGVGICGDVHAENFTCKEHLELQMNMTFEEFSN